jgi:hypothetical protein
MFDKSMRLSTLFEAPTGIHLTERDTYIGWIVGIMDGAGAGWNQFHPGPARKLSTNLYDTCHC